MLSMKIITIKSSALSMFKLLDYYEVIVVMPAIDMQLANKASKVMQRRTRQKGLLIVVEDDLRLGFIMVANMVYMNTKSRFFCYVAQDAYPGAFWLDDGLETLKKENSGLLAFNDGRFFGTIAVFGLADRKWLYNIYKNFLFYPKYKSHFGDTELTVIALQTGKHVFNPNCLLMEVDYEKHRCKINMDDDKLYRERAEAGFDGRVTPFTP